MSDNDFYIVDRGELVTERRTADGASAGECSHSASKRPIAVIALGFMFARNVGVL